MKFVSYDKATEVLQPGEQPLNLPPATVTPQWSPVLRFTPVFPIGSDHFNPPIFFQLGVKLVAVVGLVSDQAFWQFVRKGLIQSVLDQRYFMRRRACHVKRGGPHCSDSR